MKKFDHNHAQALPPLMSGYEDTYIKLSQYRTVFITEDINDTMAAQLSALLLNFDNENHEEIIHMYIHSNGGAATGLTNIYDVMQMIKAPISTICIGKCYSAAAVLLAAGTQGERYAFKNSNIMIHGIQTMFPIPGHDMSSSKNYYQHLKENNDNIMKILAKHTGHTLDKVREDCKQDVWLNAKQALEYGLVDFIV